MFCNKHESKPDRCKMALDRTCRIVKSHSLIKNLFQIKQDKSVRIYIHSLDGWVNVQGTMYTVSYVLDSAGWHTGFAETMVLQSLCSHSAETQSRETECE